MIRIDRKSVLAAGAVVAVALQFGPGQVAAAKTPFLQTADKKIQAYFIGPSCGSKVEMLFESEDADSFNTSKTPASRLMNNASRVLSRQCKKLKSITGKGVVGNRVVYSGIAQANSGWKLLDTGRRGSGILAPGLGNRGEQKRFASDPAFVPSRDLSADLVGKTFCVRPDAHRTCTGESRFSAAPGGNVSTVARYLLDEEGSEAELSYQSGHNANGFLCNPTRDVKIAVISDNLDDAGRAEYSTLLREHIESGGDIVCAGFQRSGGKLSLGTFDNDGRSLGAPAPMKVGQSPLPLRLDE